MNTYIARKILSRRGLATAKVRRRLTQREWVEVLRHGGWARALLVVVMGVLLFRLVAVGEEGWVPERMMVGGLIYSLSLAVLWLNHPQVWGDNSRLLLIFGTMVLHLEGVSWLMAHPFAVPSGEGWSELSRKMLWDLAVPYGLGPILVSVLLGQRLAVVLTIFASLLGAMLNGGMDSRFLTMSLLCGFVGALTTRRVRRRVDLLRAGVAVGVTTWVLSLLMGYIGPVLWDNLALTPWGLVGWQSAVAVASGLGAALLISAILPVVEWMFGLTTSISWLELSDLNHPLLRRMTFEAPGTYHHSLMVAHLAEAAAESIGANALMVRVCSYFHDIGKLVKPEYFVENYRHGRNAHEDLAPTMSALVIVAHVKEGVDLALKHRLKREIIDVIQQHHGTSLVSYFYNRALKHIEEARRENPGVHESDLPEVSEESFRYTGPRPQTREIAIISLADTIESASRSLEKATPHKIDHMVDELMNRRLLDGQLKECDLTMRELEEVSESFKKSLRSMMHSRIAYPKPQDKRESQPGSGIRNGVSSNHAL